MRGGRRALGRSRAVRLSLMGLLWVLILAACKPPGGLEDTKTERVVILGPMEQSEVVSHSEAYIAERAAYEPDLASIGAIAMTDGPVEVEVIFGTWCSDSELAVPRFVKILEGARARRLEMGLGELPIEVEYLAVDKEKVEPRTLLDGKAIDQVPTFIIRAFGHEVGRIVEAPEGLLEENLARWILEAAMPPAGGEPDPGPE